MFITPLPPLQISFICLQEATLPVQQEEEQQEQAAADGTQVGTGQGVRASQAGGQAVPGEAPSPSKPHTPKDANPLRSLGEPPG